MNAQPIGASEDDTDRVSDPDTVIDIRPDRYYAAIMFLGSPKTRRNWLCSVWRQGSSRWHMTYRLLNEDGSRADLKCIVVSNGIREAAMVAKARTLALELRDLHGEDDMELHVVEPKTDHAETLVRLLLQQPWFQLITPASVMGC